MNNKVMLFCDKGVEWSLYLLIFCLPFSKSGISIFSISAIIFWAGKRICGFRTDGRKGLIPSTPLNNALAIFIIFNIFSVLFSVNILVSLKAFFTKILEFVLIFFMVSETINTEKRVKRVLLIVFLSALLISSEALVQYLYGTGFLKGYKFSGRLNSSFASSNGFAGWIVMVIFLLSGWLISLLRFKKRIFNIVLCLLIIFLFICLIMTFARGAWVAFIIVFFICTSYLFIKNFLYRKILCLSIVLGVLFVVLILPQSVKIKINRVTQIRCVQNKTLTERFASILEELKGEKDQIRFGLWAEAVNIIKDYPIAGCGFNTYSIVARDYKVCEGGGIYPHNSYLHMAAETGLLGLLSFFWLLFSFFQMGIRYLNKTKDYLVLGLVAGIFGFLVHAFFDTHLYSMQMVVLFWFMMGFAVAVIRMRQFNAIKKIG